MALSFVKKIDALDLLTIAFFPDVELFFVVAHKRPQMRILKNIFDMASGSMTFVSCGKLVAKLQGLGNALAEVF